MDNDFLNISEENLWDNLKRKANESLRKLASIKTKADLLKEFDPMSRPETIQKLLEDIGKQFFKIFLYQALKDNFTNDDFNESREKVVNFIKGFKFYFWPGFTTLAKKRIHINGSKKGKDSEDRFFSGIGNTELDIRDISLLPDYLKKTPPDIYNTLFKCQGEFWIKNIPSTVAFDSVLNQFYIDKVFGKGNFEVPTTHFWKSAQRREDGTFIPMPLRKDNSEFRILEVSMGDKSGAVSEKNRISITIQPDYFTKSAFDIYNNLQRTAIKIYWRKHSDKDRYVEWPFTDQEPKHKESKLAAYSYWLSETLENQDCVLNYNEIRNQLATDGLDQLAQHIVPFRKFKGSFHDPEKLNEIYYKYWTTLFLESYSVNADLGTSMFLTSHSYSSVFLMKCANWLRWIYNELRILEATAKEEVETEDSILKLLKHTQKHYLNALEIALRNNHETGQSVGEIASFSTSVLKGHFDVLHILASTNLNTDRSQIYEEAIEFSITEIINKHIDIFSTIIKDEFFWTIIKNIHPDDRNVYQSKMIELLSDNKLANEYKLFSYNNFLVIILKEIMVNAIENIDINNPLFFIKVERENEITSIEVSNSISEFTIPNVIKNYNAFEKKIRVSKRLGWWVICQLSKLANYKIEVEDLDNIRKNKMFKVKLIVKNEEC